MGTAKRKTGRPSLYSDKLAREIIERIQCGETITKCLARAHMPSMPTFFRWLTEKEDFRDKYTQAKAEQLEVLDAEIQDIADESEFDRIEEDGKAKVNWEHIKRSELRIKARQWRAERMAAKRYKLEVSGPNQGPIQTETINRPPDMTREEWIKTYCEKK